MKDISGQRFGRLVAEKFLFYDEKFRDHWLFQCDCGNEKEMAAANVKWGRVRSCGCLAKEHTKMLRTQDITGVKFGRLTAVQPTDRRDASGSIVWECHCDCGNVVFYSVNCLMNGRTQSCGCLFRESRKECTSYRRDITDQTNLSALVSSKSVRSDNRSGRTGVYQDPRSGKWIAQITFQKKRFWLGTYAKKEKAILARKRAEEHLHDPIIREQWDKLTEHSKKKFLEHLGPSAEQWEHEKG